MKKTEKEEEKRSANFKDSGNSHLATIAMVHWLCQILAQLYSHSQSTIVPNPGTALQSQSINHCAKSWCSSTVTINHCAKSWCSSTVTVTVNQQYLYRFHCNIRYFSAIFPNTSSPWLYFVFWSCSYTGLNVWTDGAKSLSQTCVCNRPHNNCK